MFSFCELRALRLLTSVRLINSEKRYLGAQPDMHLNAIRYDRKARLRQVTISVLFFKKGREMIVFTGSTCNTAGKILHSLQPYKVSNQLHVANLLPNGCKKHFIQLNYKKDLIYEKNTKTSFSKIH